MWTAPYSGDWGGQAFVGHLPIVRHCAQGLRAVSLNHPENPGNLSRQPWQMRK